YFVSIYFIFYSVSLIFFIFTTTSTSDIYTLSLHDALPICHTAKTTTRWVSTFTTAGLFNIVLSVIEDVMVFIAILLSLFIPLIIDRKSTRLNSCHRTISYAVFCLKKKKKKKK